MRNVFVLGGTMLLYLGATPAAHPQSGPTRELKRRVVDDVEAMKKKTQVMIDMVFELMVAVLLVFADSVDSLAFAV